MLQLRTFSASLIIAAVGLLAADRDASADGYAWARSNWGNGGGPNRPVGVMGNGYGGYYVPRNAYGNNYEGQRFTNPNGFIVSGQPTYQPTSQPRQMFRRWR